MAPGYPPLFDLFSLFRSIGAVEVRPTPGSWQEQFFRAFRETFFQRSWLGAAQRELLGSYCGRTGVSPALVYDYFLQFILWRCHRFRSVSTAPKEALRVWESLLDFTVAHKDRFSLN
jgi:hypothetical protein